MCCRGMFFMMSALVLLAGSCRSNPPAETAAVESAAVEQAPAELTISSIHAARGVIEAIDVDGARLTIAHEEMPDFMDAMTMPFEVDDSAEIEGLSVGDKIAFELVMATTKSFIRDIQQLPADTELTLAP